MLLSLLLLILNCFSARRDGRYLSFFSPLRVLQGGKLLVIYPFTGSLPLVYDSSVLLIPPNQFYFPPMFRKTLLDIFGRYLLRERIRRVLDQY